MEEETLWQKTVTDLKEGILSAENATGMRFPSLTELVRDYGISKITALRVVAELEKAGLVKRIARRGTFIIGRHQSQAIKVLLDFNQDWAANALPIVWKYMRGIEAACRKANHSLQLISLDHITQSINPGDKYILLATDPDSSAYQAFSDKNCRHVFLHSPVRLPFHDCIRADHRAGGYMMTRAMIEAGHRRIAYIGGPPTSTWHAPRIRGYLDALEEAALPLDMGLIGEIASSVPRLEDAVDAVGRLLSMPNPPTAIVASDDLRALAIVVLLESRGLSVPRNIAVSGMDARAEALTRAQPLTTCDWQLEKQGEMAVDMLLFPAASANEPQEILVAPKFIKGTTL